MARAVTATKKSSAKNAGAPAVKAKAVPAAGKKPAAAATSAGKKTAGPLVVKVERKAPSGKAAATTPIRFKCRLCGYIYSPLRGEPHNGIPAGTAFEDLPETYLCPVCGQRGKGRIGKWGFDEWRPTRYLCSMCSYVYDEKRGEPHRGIKPGTKFEDLPDDYVCPVCAQDPKIRMKFGKVLKQGFEPIND